MYAISYITFSGTLSLQRELFCRGPSNMEKTSYNIQLKYILIKKLFATLWYLQCKEKAQPCIS